MTPIIITHFDDQSLLNLKKKKTLLSFTVQEI